MDKLQREHKLKKISKYNIYMKTTFLKGSNFKTFGLKSNNGSTNFGNKSQPPTNQHVFYPQHDKEPVKHFALEK
jgi:hypothetical protein